MNYFTRYFTAYFKIERFPAGGSLLSGVARKDRDALKKWFDKQTIRTTQPKTGGLAFKGYTPKAKVELHVPEWTPKTITPFEVGEGVRRPILKLTKPRKQNKVSPDKAAIAARKTEALRIAKRKVEEEVLLMALI